MPTETIGRICWKYDTVQYVQVYYNFFIINKVLIKVTLNKVITGALYIVCG